jgi:hypothetical protein
MLREIVFRSVKWAALLIGISCLSACYFVNQPAFESSVNRRVFDGMPLATAKENLRRLGLTCNEGTPVDCSRLRQRLWPSSCIERVQLTVSKSHEVEHVDIRPILCVGL